MIDLPAKPCLPIKPFRLVAFVPWQLVCLLVGAWLPIACTHFPPAVSGDPAAVRLAADIRDANGQLKGFRCMARMTIAGSNHPPQTFRAAVAGRLPDRMRMDMLTPFGAPAANFSSDGRHLYLVNHQSRDYYKTRMGSGSLRRLIHVDISVTELLGLLMGRIPVNPQWTARMIADPEGAAPGLAFFDHRGVERQRIRVDSANRPVEAVWYDRRHRLVHRLTIDGRQEVDGFTLPVCLELATDAGDRVTVRLNRYEPNVHFDDSVFSLEPLPS
jgi:outer membrane lipoprotein-sorting protein